MIFVGIDPGKKGGFAVLDHPESRDCDKVYINLTVKPTPIIPGKTKKILDGLATKKLSKDEYDVEGMVNLVKEVTMKATFFIEHQHNLPKHIARGGYTEFSIGYGYGLWIGILEALSCRYQTVRARDWHTTIFGQDGVPDTKKASVDAACKLWFKAIFMRTPRSRKPDHGLTDAALIAEYGRRIYTAQCNQSERKER